MQKFKEKVEEAIKKRSFELLKREEWHKWHLADLADLLLSLDKTDRAVLFRLWPRDIAADVFSYLDKENKNSLLKDLTDEETRLLLANLKPDDRTDLLEELPGQVTQRLLNLLSYEDLLETRFLLGYPEKSVGRLMTPEYVAVRPEWKVAEALEHIRSKGKKIETLSTVYVTDEKWKLLDALGIEKFVLASPDAKVADIMDNSFISLSAFDDQEKAVQVMQKYDISALPVTDSDGILLGVVTFDDIFDVVQEETTEDFQRGAAVTPLTTDYGQVSFKELFRKRAGWLVALVFVMLLASEVIASYEEVLTKVIALAFFIPLLIDVGGNTGSQAATLMVRALATGDIKLSEWFTAFRKELVIGLLLGLTMGVVVGAFGLWRGGYEIGLVVGLSMVIIVLFTNLLGIFLPFLLAKFKVDPAVASSPLVTSIADIAGLLIYFAVAVRILNLT
ncbi:magnesium transporter [Thermosyntropha lipolytica DSM 11003]|uniref:Magnesium transporter MgtE n=1 Tax=Thermosyntropha lipolytica DSM 11003 TaxID=1123382 RepID=A0A1M5JDZ8_9FIRM|nr:magnesium transporter [Thermosyntropha lipolytica]SHG38792.1 magnesium transporter [Thermosyntropha lipolytica DSM 11003]